MSQKISKEAQDFIDTHSKNFEIIGFWNEEYKPFIIKCIERNCTPEVIRYMTITDITVNGDKFLLKWQKRFQALSDEEMEKEYGFKQK